MISLDDVYAARDPMSAYHVATRGANEHFAEAERLSALRQGAVMALLNRHGTLQAVADLLGISKNRVSQLKIAARRRS